MFLSPKFNTLEYLIWETYSKNIKNSSQENKIVHKRTVSFTENHKHLLTAGVNGPIKKHKYNEHVH